MVGMDATWHDAACNARGWPKLAGSFRMRIETATFAAYHLKLHAVDFSIYSSRLQIVSLHCRHRSPEAPATERHHSAPALCEVERGDVRPHEGRY